MAYVYLVSGWVAFSLVAGFWLAASLRRPASQSRRRGGYVKPPALFDWNQAGTGGYSTLPTLAVSSSWTEPGEGSAGVAVLPTPPRPSSGGARTSSGNVTAARGVSGRTQAERADSAEGAALLRRNRGDDAA